jgi:HNH endonuclease
VYRGGMPKGRHDGPFRRRLPDAQPRACEWCSVVFTPERKYPEQRLCSLACQRAYATSLRRSQAELAKLSAWALAAKYRGTGKNPKGYIKLDGRHEHRVLAERLLGRPLRKGEIVHHMDHNPKNNDLENLMVITRSEHIRLHWPEMYAARLVSNKTRKPRLCEVAGCSNKHLARGLCSTHYAMRRRREARACLAR